MTDESKSRDEICAVGLSIFQRGLTFGSTGRHQRAATRRRLA